MKSMSNKGIEEVLSELREQKKGLTFCLIKPEGFLNGLMEELIHRFTRKGLKIYGLKMMRLNSKIISDHYPHLIDKPFYKDLEAGMMSGPVVAMCIGGPKNIVSLVRKMVGPTDPADGTPGELRFDYSTSIDHNRVHATDNDKDVLSELQRFFNPEDIVVYDSSVKVDWMFKQDKKN